MKTILQEILDRTPECLGAAVVGTDGIAVEKVSAGSKGFSIDLASAEGINIIKRAAATLRGTPSEHLEELSYTSGSVFTVLRALGSDYYLVVVTKPGGIPGKARYEAWKAGLQLRQAIG